MLLPLFFSILGGSDKILKVILAVLLVGMLQLVIQLNNVPGIVMSIFTGLLLIISLALPIV